MNTNRRPEIFSIIWHHYLRYMKDKRSDQMLYYLFQLAVYFQSEYLISVIQVRSGLGTRNVFCFEKFSPWVSPSFELYWTTITTIQCAVLSVSVCLLFAIYWLGCCCWYGDEGSDLKIFWWFLFLPQTQTSK